MLYVPERKGIMKLLLIRHGKTKGNLEKRYIGTTDEPLCEEGIRELCTARLMTEDGEHSLQPARILASPMKRCLETAEILFPGREITVLQDLRECDFGDFENKNYLELAGNEEYQRWIDSGGTFPFPHGEAQEDFRARCCRAFENAVTGMEEEGIGSAAFVVHGGTIMAVMERFACPAGSYYDFQVNNGKGYLLEGQNGRYGYKKLL